jgi:hypothetical protein
MAFSRDLIPRLAYAKQMYLHGYEHGKGQGFLNKSLAIISIDGAIERFLWTIITEFNVSSKLAKRPNFFQVWKAADDAVGNKLPLKSEIENVHDIRNAAQHKGMVPSDRAIDSSLIYTEDFLTQSYMSCFRLKFNELSISDLVLDSDLRTNLKRIEDFLSKKDYENAIKASAITFDELKKKYMQYYGDVAFDRGHHFILDFLFSICDMKDPSEEAKRKRKTLENIMNSIVNELDRINDRVYAISLGANMQDYLFFRNNTPRVKFAIKGPLFTSSGSITYSEEKTKKILNFLQNIIIHWESLIA